MMIDDIVLRITAGKTPIDFDPYIFGTFVAPWNVRNILELALPQKLRPTHSSYLFFAL